MAIDRNRLAWFGGVCLAVGLVVWLLVDSSGPLPGEFAAMGDLRSFWGHHVTVQEVAQFMADLGSRSIAAITVIAATLIVARNVDWSAAWTIPLAALAALVADGLKSVVGLTSVELRQPGFMTGGFPSGHTAYATATFGLLAVLGWRYRRREVTVVMVGLVLLMGPAMVMRQAHPPSDVIAGYALGGAWLCGVLLLASYVAQRRAR